jgi:hypothetical protein
MIHLDFQNRFRLVLILTVLLVVITRLPFFLHYTEGIIIAHDSFSYYKIVGEMVQGNLPYFYQRPPLYPLILGGLNLISAKTILVPLFQVILTLYSSLLFLRVVGKHFPKHFLLFALSLWAYLGTNTHTQYDLMILTEGVFSSLIVFLTALTIESVKTNALKEWMKTSLVIVSIFLLKPSSLFILPYLLLVLSYFIWQKKYKWILSFITPVISIYFVLCAYNYATTDRFTISALGQISLAGTVACFAEPNPHQPAYIKETIELIKPSYEQQQTLKGKYSYKSFYEIFNTKYLEFQSTVASKGHSYYIGKSKVPIFRTVDDLKEMNLRSIKLHPDLYFRFVQTMFINYYHNFLRDPVFYNEEVTYAKHNFSTTNEIFRHLENEEHTATNHTYTVDSPFVKSLYYYSRIHHFVFKNILILLAFFASIILCIVNFIRYGFLSQNNLIALLLTSIVISNSVLVALVQQSLIRYSFPFELIYYLVPLLIFLSLKSPQILKHGEQ